MADKNLIVYYSMLGNTMAVAKEIEKQTSFTAQRIEEYKVRKRGNLIGNAMGAFLGFRSKIRPMDFLISDYNNILLGAQVWAGKTTPAMNTYLRKASFKGKKVWLFITKADEKIPQGIIDSMTDRIEKKGGKVIDSISITAGFDPKVETVISQEEISAAVHEWLVKNGFLS